MSNRESKNAPKTDARTTGDGSTNERYDEALEQLMGFGPSYGGGLSNHGPMALESLATLNLAEHFQTYVDRVSPTLEPTDDPYRAAAVWQNQLLQALPSLVASAGAQAGHGLLRTAHAVRALERADTDVRRRELTAAIQYWGTGSALKSPTALSGTRALADVLADLPRLGPDRRPEGLLVAGLEQAMEEPGVMDLVSSIEPAADIAAAFDQLALAACAGLMNNTGLGQFTLLHGVTVSVMAQQLLGYLDPPNQRRLEAAVTGFVVAAVVGFDDGDASIDVRPIEPGDVESELGRLSGRAAFGADDHDIKLACATTQLARRTGSVVPVQALAVVIGI